MLLKSLKVFTQKNISIRYLGRNVRNAELQPISRKNSLFIRTTCFTAVSISSIYVGSVILGYENFKRNANKIKTFTHETKGFFLDQFRPLMKRNNSRKLSESEKVFLAILGLNVAVYLIHFANLRLGRYFFCSIESSIPALSQLTSVFSHTSIVHLAMNMYVLHSFIDPLVQSLGREQFIALYVSGGIFASWLSMMRKISVMATIPSLGASGCICAVIAFYCSANPQGLLCVPLIENIFPHSFSAEKALNVILMIEAMGFLFFQKYSIIDHSAHFGGLLFGLCYYKLGHENVQLLKSRILKNWILLKKNTGLSK